MTRETCPFDSFPNGEGGEGSLGQGEGKCRSPQLVISTTLFGNQQKKGNILNRLLLRNNANIDLC